ncbi:hypothetical protein [Sorangium sp. So ce406]|uniref:hypothetical protein n=1 Tax=Sorangium sp. So ce406 TaxID=3133311 RepID=UPI003F5C19CB
MTSDSEDNGSIRAALTVGGERHDVTAVHFKVVDLYASCSDAAIAETTSSLEEEALPGSVVPAGAANHAGADGLFVLPPGDYRVCVSPLGAEGPSRECAPTEGTASVFSAVTTEVLLVSQCGAAANGGLDVIVALNDPPRLNDLDITPSKFITQCETATIAVAAEDPDGDPVTYSWAVLSAPPGAAPVLNATDAVADFSTDTPGDYQLQVVVSDVYAAASSLIFPVHVSAEECGACACPDGFTALPDGGCARAYDIDASLLVNQNDSCDFTGEDRYNGCNGEPYGFQWTDAGAGLSVARVDVEFETGITCSGGNRTAWLNGAPIGSFDTVGLCECESPSGLVSLQGVGTGSYIPGGVNTVTIPADSCEGLSQSGSLGGSFARVTVTYSCGPVVQEGNVGYYDMAFSQGNPTQERPIVTAGGTPVNVFDLSARELTALDVLFVQNPDNASFGSEYLGQLGAIEEAVASGLVLIIHDRFVDTANTILPGGSDFTILRDFADDRNIEIVDPTTLVTNGPGGVINNASLDNGSSSSHGFVVSGTLPGGSARILSRTSPEELVTMCYPYGAGAVVYSTIPLDHYLQGGSGTEVEANLTQIYAPNVVAYGLAGACSTRR